MNYIESLSKNLSEVTMYDIKSYYNQVRIVSSVAIMRGKTSDLMMLFMIGQEYGYEC